MALGQRGALGFATAGAGFLAFLLGIIAENKKPTIIPATQQGVLIVCSYPSDPYVALGFLSVALLAISTVSGVISIFFPYNKTPVPLSALARSHILVVFGIVSIFLFVMAEMLLLWATLTESWHELHKVPVNAECPTAKTGLMGGAAFLALDTTLFWLVCQMLTMNAREDYFELNDDDGKGSYGAVLAADYTAAAPHPGPKA